MMKLTLLLLATTVLASPILDKRYYDYDHDDIPDWCETDTSGMIHCLERQASDSLVWTSFLASSTAEATSTTTQITTATSSTTISHSSAKATLNPISSQTIVIQQSKAVASQQSNVVSSVLSVPTVSLPSTKLFLETNNTKWHVSKVGTIYSSTVPDMGWDNGRTSVLNNTLFWNFGDVLSLDGLMNGFSTGPAFYGTPDDMLRVDMKNITKVANLLFVPPSPSDPVPQAPTPFWGLSTGNVAEVSPGVGIGFVWEIWRSVDGLTNDQGLGIYKATLGEDLPIGTRTGPLVTGPNAIQVGIMTILAAEGYIYTYTNGGPSGIIIGRSKIASAFDISSYEFLKLDGSWVVGVPDKGDESYGVQGEGVGDGSGEVVHSDGQGSVFWSNYFERYLLFTCAYGTAMMFYVSETPFGPWTGQYKIEDVQEYGINVHPFFSPDGSHKTIYVSSGVDNIISMFKVEFDF